MIIQCAGCRLILGRKAPYSNKSVTHSYCRKCELTQLVTADLATKKEVKEFCTIMMNKMEAI